MKPTAILAATMLAAVSTPALAELAVGTVYEAKCNTEDCTIKILKPGPLSDAKIYFHKGTCEFTASLVEKEGALEGVVEPWPGSLSNTKGEKVYVLELGNHGISMQTDYEGCDDASFEHVWRTHQHQFRNRDHKPSTK